MLNKLPRIIQDIIKLLFGNVATKIIGIGVLMFYVRVLSKEEMAVFPVYLMLSDLANLLFSMGLFPNLIKRLPSLIENDMLRARSFLLTSSFLVVSGTIVTSVFSFIYCEKIATLLLNNSEYAELIKIMTVGFVALSISKLSEQVMWAVRRFGEKSILNVVGSIVRPLLTISFYFAVGVKGIIIGLVATQCFKLMLSLFYTRDVFFGEMSGVYPIRKLLKESLPFYLESYLMYFRREGDNWLISTMLGPKILAIYYIAKTIYSSFFMFFSSVDSVVTERLAVLKNDQILVCRTSKKLFTVISQTSIPIIFFSISLLPFLVLIIGGKLYMAAIQPAAILLLVVLVSFLKIPINRTVFVASKSKYRFALTFIETCILFVCLLVLTPVSGIIGVAGSRLISQLVGGLFGIWLLKRLLALSFNIKIIFIMLLSTVPGTLCTLIFNYYFFYYYSISTKVIVLGFFIAAIWLFMFLSLSLYINQELINNMKKIIATYKILIFNKKITKSL